MINEANASSSACRLWHIPQVETSAPPKANIAMIAQFADAVKPMAGEESSKLPGEQCVSYSAAGIQFKLEFAILDFQLRPDVDLHTEQAVEFPVLCALFNHFAHHAAVCQARAVNLLAF